MWAQWKDTLNHFPMHLARGGNFERVHSSLLLLGENRTLLTTFLKGIEFVYHTN